MNRLLGQQAQLNTNPSSRSPSIDSTRSPPLSPESTRSPLSTTTESVRPMPNLQYQRARSPSSDPNKRPESPHIAHQALSPSSAVSRKPLDTSAYNAQGGRDRNNSNESAKFQFDDVTPSPSAHASMMPTELELDPQVKLEDYDWAGLEDQFEKRMQAFKAEEDGIWEEWRGWNEIFKAWASTISVHDEERASKR